MTMTTNTTAVTAEMVTGALAQRAEIDLIGEYGRGHHREIRYNAVHADGRGMYHVYDHGALIMSTTSAEVAAESYNAIRPQAVSR